MVKRNVEMGGGIIFVTVTVLIIFFVIGLYFFDDFFEGVLAKLPNPKDLID